jgi:L-idonate 5-dehydrogenase
MKAVVIHAARDLRVEERAPEPVGPGQVEIAIAAGGICGSDLHYYQDGGFGTVRVREPMILGHEIAGTITAIGPGVSGFVAGDRVAVSPSRPCNSCEFCLKGEQNHCRNMRFYGSAMVMPHIQGGFRQLLVAEAWQCHRIADGVLLSDAAFAEPFAVTLHAVARAGALLGKRVLVTGCGPIGTLAIMAARLHGAREIVATDIVDEALAKAREVGADLTINVAAEPGALGEYGRYKGHFDVQLECSGSERALVAGFEAVRPRGVIVQIGLGGNLGITQSALVAKEVELRGSFRFHEEFGLAVDLINARRVNFAPLLTASYPVVQAVEAFELAGDRRRAMKVQLAFA